MTRKEEIKCASKDYINYLLDKQEYHNENYTEYDIRQAFEKGAMFADHNPDISSLWHDASEEPKIGSNIVAINGNDKWWDIQPYDGYYNWRNWVSSYDIKKWAYIYDILPKGGLK